MKLNMLFIVTALLACAQPLKAAQPQPAQFLDSDQKKIAAGVLIGGGLAAVALYKKYGAHVQDPAQQKAKKKEAGLVVAKTLGTAIGVWQTYEGFTAMQVRHEMIKKQFTNLTIDSVIELARRPLCPAILTYQMAKSTLNSFRALKA